MTNELNPIVNVKAPKGKRFKMVEVRSNEEKLIEEVARLMMNRDYDAGEVWCAWEEKAKEAQHTRGCYIKTATQIHELYKKYTYLKGNEKLPIISDYSADPEIIEDAQQDMIRAGFKSTEEWKK